MAVALRLSRRGQKGKPFYRIVATDKENKRDGKFIEVIGVYNPMVNPPVCELKNESVTKWINNGAQPSKQVENLIRKNIPGLIEGRAEHRTKKIQAVRRARKERAKSRSSKAKN